MRTTKTRSRCMLAAVLAAALLAATACGAAGGGGGEPGKLRVALASLGVPFMQLFAAEQQGFYKKHGVEVNFIEVQGSANATAAAESGQADATVMLPEGVIQARSQGSKLKMFGATVNQSLYRFYAQAAITSLDQVAGKKVAMLVEGNGTHIQAQWLLDEHGPGQDAVTYVATGGLSDRLAALQTNQVAASLLFPPFDVQAEQAGLKPLAVMSDYVQGYPNEVLAATEQTLANKSEEVRAFMRAVTEGAKWLVEHPDAAVQLAVDRFGGDPEIMRKAYEFTAEFYALDGAVPEEGLQWTLDVMQRYAGLEDPPSIEDLYDPSFLPATS